MQADQITQRVGLILSLYLYGVEFNTINSTVKLHAIFSYRLLKITISDTIDT